MKNIFRISGVILIVFLIFLIHSCKKDKPAPPIITTTAASAITQTAATSGGNVTSDGGASVTARGVCWSTSANPTTALSTKTSDNTGTGIFSSSITGLTAGTTYYVKAFTTNSVGTSYGNEVSFATTSATAPVLTTIAVSSITQTNATSGGNVTSDGGASVTARGVCWSTTSNPTISLSTKTTEGTVTGTFISALAGLTAGTVYYVRAYATNSTGTAYGNGISFITTAATVSILTTTVVTAITQITATSGGNVTSDGGATVTARGVCWSTTTGPTTALSTKTIDRTGTGIFTSSITALTAGTVYYVKAYATNSAGTAYGNEISFTSTASTVPVLTTTAASAITQTSATSGGNITSDGGAAIVNRGVCWSTSTNPTIALSTKTTDNTGTGIFTSSITGLTVATLYYVRAYATNSVGIIYGNEISFTAAATVPTLTTTAVSSITQTSTISGGNITSDGGAAIVNRGVCWSTSTNPTIALSNKTIDNMGTGIFTSSITGLTPSTTYYLRAFATNFVGTSYGDDITFTTASTVPGAPTIGTASAGNAQATVTFTAPGSNGGSAITGYTVTSSPGSITGIGTTSPITVTGLTNETAYSFTVTATNAIGTSVASASSNSVTPSSSLTSDIDGNSYNTVIIGTQVWMKENLKTTKYNDGTAIPLVTDGTAWVALTSPGYCWYNNDAATYKATYGALYNWYTLNSTSNSGKNVCPTGWHVPSDAEWTTLITFLGGESVAGGKLKETGTTHWAVPTGATNETGFTALPGGYRYSYGTFSDVGYAGYWWSSAEQSTDNASSRLMYFNSSSFFSYYFDKRNGISVRCLMDN